MIECQGCQKGENSAAKEHSNLCETETERVRESASVKKIKF